MKKLDHENLKQIEKEAEEGFAEAEKAGDEFAKNIFRGISKAAKEFRFKQN